MGTEEKTIQGTPGTLTEILKSHDLGIGEQPRVCSTGAEISEEN